LLQQCIDDYYYCFLIFYQCTSLLITSSSTSLLSLEPNLARRQDELHKAGVSVDDVLDVLLARGVEVRRVPKLHRVPVDLRQLLVSVPAAETPIVTRSTGGVQTNGLLGNVFAASDRVHGIGGAVGSDSDVVPVLLIDVLSVDCVLDDSALAVVGRVEEVLLGVVGLVDVVAPGVEEGSGSGVNIDVPVDVRVLAVHPRHVPCLGLGEGCSSVERLGCGVCGGWGHGGVELLREVPEEVEVPVKIYADAEGLVGPGRGRVAVLPPEVAVGLVMAHAVGVEHGDEDNSSTKSFLNVAVGVLFVAISKANTVLVCVEQIRDEVNQVVGSTAFASMDT
jgi:hypothetical protein